MTVEIIYKNGNIETYEDVYLIGIKEELGVKYLKIKYGSYENKGIATIPKSKMKKYRIIDKRGKNE